MESGCRIVNQFATYFMTFTVVGWVDVFTRRKCKDIIIDSLKYCQQNKGLVIYAYVLMESHLHIVASAREDSKGMSAIVRDFKKYTSKKIIAWVQDNPSESRRHWLRVVFQYHAKYNSNNKDYQVWQQHSMPILCTTPYFTWQKINYIHNNPIKSDTVDDPVDFKYSSARNYANRKDYVLDVVVLDIGNEVGIIW
jgi:REP element-mobilizing transposase RayT